MCQLLPTTRRAGAGGSNAFGVAIQAPHDSRDTGTMGQGTPLPSQVVRMDLKSPWQLAGSLKAQAVELSTLHHVFESGEKDLVTTDRDFKGLTRLNAPRAHPQVNIVGEVLALKLVSDQAADAHVIGLGAVQIHEDIFTNGADLHGDLGRRDFFALELLNHAFDLTVHFESVRACKRGRPSNENPSQKTTQGRVGGVFPFPAMFRPCAVQTGLGQRGVGRGQSTAFFGALAWVFLRTGGHSTL